MCNSSCCICDSTLRPEHEQKYIMCSHCLTTIPESDLCKNSIIEITKNVAEQHVNEMKLDLEMSKKTIAALEATTDTWMSLIPGDNFVELTKYHHIISVLRDKNKYQQTIIDHMNTQIDFLTKIDNSETHTTDFENGIVCIQENQSMHSIMNHKFPSKHIQSIANREIGALNLDSITTDSTESFKTCISTTNRHKSVNNSDLWTSRTVLVDISSENCDLKSTQTQTDSTNSSLNCQ